MVNTRGLQKLHHLHSSLVLVVCISPNVSFAVEWLVEHRCTSLCDPVPLRLCRQLHGGRSQHQSDDLTSEDSLCGRLVHRHRAGNVDFGVDLFRRLPHIDCVGVLDTRTLTFAYF